MFSIVELLIAITILLIGLVIYSVFTQKNSIDSFSSEFIEVIEEANYLRDELKLLMENAIEISGVIVDGVDKRISIDNSDSLAKNKLVLDELSLQNLAKQYGLTTEQVDSLLKDLENNYTNTTTDILKIEFENTDTNFINPEDNVFYPKSNKNNFLTVVNETNNDSFWADKEYITAEIIDLHNQGYSIKEIAKLLNKGQGEISLLLNLSKNFKAI
ncbi:MAG: helix-turn-helix domain-containing protein [Syntrophomonadaceae bacterium]|nr:helix-turn-helix domain-containing protein [Syntrophomonadaceae bacterium]